MLAPFLVIKISLTVTNYANSVFTVLKLINNKYKPNLILTLIINKE